MAEHRRVPVLPRSSSTKDGKLRPTAQEVDALLAAVAAGRRRPTCS